MKKRLLVLAVALLAVLAPLLAHADLESDLKAQKESMQKRQAEVESAFDVLDVRVNEMDQNTPRFKAMQIRRDTAREAVEAFTDVSVEDFEKKTPTQRGNIEERFREREAAAVEALNEANWFLVAPIRPSNAPEGDLLESFLPHLIRQFFIFSSTLVLVILLIVSVMMITSYDNEERVQQAKKALYYVLVGFAFIVLAYAIVTAVTTIDFFNFSP